MRILQPALVALLLAATLPACASLRSHPIRGEVLTEAGGASMSALDAAIARSRIVHVGESHDQRSHHAMQAHALDVMHHASSAPLMVGMEMFQRPFQRHLDDYVKGLIDEREMLRRTEWYTRWSMDHTQYAPIWRYCRQHGLRVVALNTDRAIIRKISREGFDALTAPERGQIAEEIVLDVASHRARIEGVFTGDGAHEMPADRLEGMYRSQTTWDETMAESAAMALEEAGPGARMVVVAGSYHVQQWDGIPDRLARRIGEGPDLLVVCRSGDAREGEPPMSELADFMVRFPAVEEPPAPKLGVMFDPAPRFDGLQVMGVVPEGSAAKGGMLAGDVLQGFGPDAFTTDLTDVRYFLDQRALGDEITATVRRDPGLRTLSITLAPAPPRPPAVMGPNPHQPAPKKVEAAGEHGSEGAEGGGKDTDGGAKDDK